MSYILTQIAEPSGLRARMPQLIQMAQVSCRVASYHGIRMAQLLRIISFSKISKSSSN